MITFGKYLLFITDNFLFIFSLTEDAEISQEIKSLLILVTYFNLVLILVLVFVIKLQRPTTTNELPILFTFT